MNNITVVFTLLCCISYKPGFGQYIKHSANIDSIPEKDIPKPRQAIYAEFGGAGVISSISYDHRLSNKYNGFGYRAGITSNLANITGVPVGIYYLLGHKSNFFETGIGEALLFSKKNSFQQPVGGYPEDYEMQYTLPVMIVDMPPGKTEWVSSCSIGYRLQDTERGYSLRTGLTFYSSSKGITSGGLHVSVGYCFY